MDLHQQAEIARLMTGSTLSDEDIFKEVSDVSDDIRISSYQELKKLEELYHKPFDQAFVEEKEHFKKIAVKYELDPAVLFWIYMEQKHKED